MRVITAPTVEPVSLAEAKRHLNLMTSETDDDAIVTDLISVAREAAEGITHRAIGAQTLEVSVDGPWTASQVFTLPRPPLVSVTSITVDDVELDASEYVVRTDTYLGTVSPVEAWPAGDVMKIRYGAGWSAADTPKSVKQWMLVKIADLYAKRESYTIGQGHTVSEMPRSFVDSLLDQHIVPVVA